MFRRNAAAVDAAALLLLLLLLPLLLVWRRCCCCCCFLCVATAADVVAAAGFVMLLLHADATAAGAADLVPAKVKLYIFYGMPKKTKLKTIFAPLCGQSPEQVMAPAVADSHKLGYDKLYRLLLDHVSIAIALLPLVLASLCLRTAKLLFCVSWLP